MDVILEWIHKNKEWLFSGIGVAVLCGFLKIIFSKESVKNYLKAMFNYKSNVTQINIENKDNE